MIQIYVLLFFSIYWQARKPDFSFAGMYAVVVMVVEVDAVVEHRVDKVISFWYIIFDFNLSNRVCVGEWDLHFAYIVSPTGAVLPKIIPTSYQLYVRVF